MLYEVLQVSSQVSVILHSYHQRRDKTFCGYYQSVCVDSVGLCFVNFGSGSKIKIKNSDYYFQNSYVY